MSKGPRCHGVELRWKRGGWAGLRFRGGKMGGMGGDFSACNRTLQECHSSHYPAQCNKHILTVLGFSIKKYLQCVLERNNGGSVRAEKLVSWAHCLYLPVSARYKLATAKGGRGAF